MGEPDQDKTVQKQFSVITLAVPIWRHDGGIEFVRNFIGQKLKRILVSNRLFVKHRLPCQQFAARDNDTVGKTAQS